jgi:transcriptional regulator with XRE-family HTH domain
MTQIDLASRAGVSRPTLVRIESGHPRPEMDVVLRIVSALGLAIDAIPEPPAPIDLDALIDSTSSFDACSSSGASVEGGSRG